MSASDPREERLVSLELLIMHLERDLGALNAALLDQQKQIDSLKRVLSRLEDRVSQMSDDSEPREPGDERPPHY
jgi:SlyX protein